MKYTIIRLSDRPDLMEIMAGWFHKKWGIPKALYIENMTECLSAKSAVPQWYAVLDGARIVGGAGIIENDFHERKDLAPNLCALFVEEDKRGLSIAGALLDYVCCDMKEKGVNVLYLVTDHDSFYERYGWEFLCEVKCDGESVPSRMYVHKVK